MLREALQILVHEGLLVSSWGVGSFVTDHLPSIVKGRNTDVNVPLPLQRIEPHWTLLTDEETTAAAEDAVAAALGIAPGENVFRRRRTYGVSGRTWRSPTRRPPEAEAISRTTVPWRLMSSPTAHTGPRFFERTSRCCRSTRRYLTSTAGRSA